MTTIETLPSTFPAAILEAPRQLRIREVPMWPLESYGDPDMVLIKVAVCGVCGSDFRYFLGENPWAQHTLGRFVPNPPNIALGHEYAGTVVAVLCDKNEHLLGKRVAPICSKVCGSCPDCQAGRTRLCPNTVHMGHGQGWGQQPFFPGAYGHYAPAWGASCYEIDDGLAFEEAAMMDILAVCAHVSDIGAIQPGRPILTIGGGPAGNGVAQISKLLGASRAVVIDRSTRAIDTARATGLADTIHTGALDHDELVAALQAAAPEGYGTVFDTVGTGDTLDLALSVLGKAGTLVNLAVHDEEIPINWMRLGSERRVVTSCNFEVGDYPKALAWLQSKRLDVKPWLTQISLQELPSRFEEITGSKEGKKVFKLVVDPFLA